jgi:hypothetical protein
VLDFAAWGIRRVLVDLRVQKRQRVRNGHMTGNVREDDGIFGSDGIKLLAIWESLIRPESVVPAAAGNPFAFFVMRHSISDALLQFLDARDTGQGNGKEVGSRAAKMDVRIVETGHDKLALKLDGLGAFLASATFEEHVIHFANAADLAVGDGHGFCPRLRRIVGVDAAVNVVGGARAALLGASSGVKEGNRNKQSERK